MAGDKNNGNLKVDLGHPLLQVKPAQTRHVRPTLNNLAHRSGGEPKTPAQRQRSRPSIQRIRQGTRFSYGLGIESKAVMSDSQCRSMDNLTIQSRGELQMQRSYETREMAYDMHKERVGGVHHEENLRSIWAVVLQQS